MPPARGGREPAPPPVGGQQPGSDVPGTGAAPPGGGGLLQPPAEEESPDGPDATGLSPEQEQGMVGYLLGGEQ